MRTVYEPARNIPVIGSFDVAVCGGGPAGFIAAVAAARNGVRTILIERYGFLGGMATLSMVSPISVTKKNGKKIIDGIPGEFIYELDRLGGAITDYPNGNIPFDPELYKLVSQRMVLGSGANLLLHSHVTACIKSENNPGQITHLIIESKSGRQAIEARYVIDATGDADLLYAAGFPVETGEENKALQPMTLWFRLGGVDTEKLENMHMRFEKTRYYNKRVSDLLRDMSACRAIPNFGGPWFITTLRNHEASVNMTRYAGDGTDVEHLTNAECVMREDIFRFIDILREHFPEFRNCYLLDSGVQAGIRETRRIKGVYAMTAEDILAPKGFADTVAKGAHPIDIHKANGNGQQVSFIEDAYNIPYRSMLPVGSKNCIAAGRCIASTREAFASIRVQATCMALGQAAGLAAAMCGKMNKWVHELDGGALSRELKAQGAIV